MKAISLTGKIILVVLSIFISSQKLSAQVINVTLSTQRTIEPDHFGLNGQNIYSANGTWENSSLRTALSDFGGSALRFPGGTNSNWANWQTGWFRDQSQIDECYTTPEIFHDFETQLNGAIHNTIAEYAKSVHLNNASSFDNLNLLTSDINTEVARLMAEREANIPLKYVELGNEFYIGNCEYVQKYIDGSAYANDANGWSSSLKSNLGVNFRIGVVNALPSNGSDDREVNWNNQVILNPISSDVDAVVLHRYSGAGISEDISSNNAYKMLLQPWRTVDGIYGLKKEIDNINNVLGANKEIWVTEYDLFERNYVVHGSWAHGLFAAHLALKMLECADVTHELNHAMIGNYVFGNMFDDVDDFNISNDFKNPVACSGCATPTPATIPHTYTAKGLALQLISKATKNCNYATQLSFPLGPNLGTIAVWPSGNVTVPALYGWMFENINSNSAEAIVLNMSPNSVMINMNGVAAFDGSEMINCVPEGFVYATSATSYSYFLNCPGCTSLTGGLVNFTNPSTGGNITLPPYSIIRLFKCSDANAVTINAATNPVCNNGTTSVYVDGSSDLTYLWSPNGETTSSIEAMAGTYTVTITDCSGATNTLSTTITTYSTQSISFSPASLSVCPDGVNNHVTFTATLSGGGTNHYAWVTAPGFIAGVTNGLSNQLEVQPETTTTYTVYATDGTCATHANYTVTVSPKITLEKDHTICIGKPYTFNGINPLSGTYQWFANGVSFSSSQSPTITPSVNFNNNYSVVYTNSSGCSSSYEINLTAVNCCAELYHFPALTTATDIVTFFQNHPLLATTVANPPLFPNYDFQITADPSYTTTPYEFEGEVIMDKKIILTGFNNLKFDEAAQVTIEHYNSLRLEGCNLAACTPYQWKGINTKRFGNIYTQTGNNNVRTAISDAEYAAQAENGTVVNLRNTDFINNYTGVYTPPVDVNAGTQYQNEIKLDATGNSFTCPAPLLTPYYGQATPSAQFTFAGMHLNDMAATIGNTAAVINTFDNINNGILGINSSLVVTNSYFNKIDNFDNYTVPVNGANGTGIYSAADVGKYASLTEQGLGIAQLGWNHTFDRCLIGIYANNASLSMSLNHMVNMFIGAIANNNSLTKIDISYNEIEADALGIALGNNDASRSINVEQNQVTSTGGTTLLWGIRARDFGFPLPARRKYSINCNNVWGDFRYQIDLNSIRSVSLRNNNSYMSSNSATGLVSGISMYGCYNAVADGNTVTGTGNGNATSFLFSQSPNATVINNTSGDAVKGFDFLGACTNSKFITNTIGVHNTGLHLNGSGIMGQQFNGSTNPVTVYNNQWQADPNQTVYGSGFGAVNDNSQSPAAVLQSQFIVNNQNGNPLIGDAEYPHFDVPSFSGTPWIAPNPTAILASSTFNYDCKIFLADGEERLTQLDERIAKDSIVTVDFEPETKFITSSDLFDKLDKNDSLKNSSLLYQTFYLDKETETTGQLSKTRTAIASIYADETGKAEQVALNDNLIQALLINKTANDSLLISIVSTTDSLNLINENNDLMQQVNILRQQTNSLLVQLNYERQNKISAALALNDAISAFSIIESNEKSINEIYLAKFILSNFNLTTSQIATLHYVADQCPFAGGRSVYAARAMLELLGDNAIYNDGSVCAALGYYRKKNITEGRNNSNLFISSVPNPASTLVKFSYSLPENTDGKIEIRNITGELLFEKKLQHNSRETDINLKRFESGFYFVLLKAENKLLAKNKLTVIK